MLVGESSTLERVNLLLTPNAVDFALASGVVSVRPNVSSLDSFFRHQVDSSFNATELTLVMRHGKRDPRFADGAHSVYGDIRRLPKGELDYVGHHEIDPATVVDMEVVNWNNTSLGAQLIRGEAQEKKRAARVAMDRRSLQIGTVAAWEVLLGLNTHETGGTILGTGLGVVFAALGVYGRRLDYVTKVRTCDINAPIAQYYKNFIVYQRPTGQPAP